MYNDNGEGTRSRWSIRKKDRAARGLAARVFGITVATGTAVAFWIISSNGILYLCPPNTVSLEICTTITKMGVNMIFARLAVTAGMAFIANRTTLAIGRGIEVKVYNIGTDND